MRDDLSKLPIPAEAKAYNRGHGMATMKKQPQSYINDQLAEADVARIGAPPRRPVVAEDIRDLQRWTGHGRGRYAGGWSFLLFLGFLRGCDSRSSGLSMPAIMPVATRV